jgi:anti-sigma B factor antagonist
MTRDAFAGRLDISISLQDGAVVLRAEGEVDLDNAEQLATALRSAASEPGDPMVLDLLGVPFMDSSGLKTLLVALGELGDRLVLAVSPGSPVVTLLELAEVRDRFTVHGTPQEAIRARGGDGG